MVKGFGRDQEGQLFEQMQNNWLGDTFTAVPAIRSVKCASDTVWVQMKDEVWFMMRQFYTPVPVRIG